MHRQQFAKDRRQRRHDTDARGDAEQATGKPKPQRLQQKDAKQISRIARQRP